MKEEIKKPDPIPKIEKPKARKREKPFYREEEDVVEEQRPVKIIEVAPSVVVKVEPKPVITIKEEDNDEIISISSGEEEDIRLTDTIKVQEK